MKNFSLRRDAKKLRKEKFELVCPMLLRQIRGECEHFAQLKGYETPHVVMLTEGGLRKIVIKYTSNHGMPEEKLLALIDLSLLKNTDDIRVEIYTEQGMRSNFWTIEGVWSPRKMVREDLSDLFIKNPTAASAAG